MDQNNQAALATFAVVYFVVLSVFVVAVLAFSIWVYWRILAKAGFNGALSLLILTGVGQIVILIIMAFGRWPIEDQLAALQSGRSPTQPPPPPGTSVIPTA